MQVRQFTASGIGFGNGSVLLAEQGRLGWWMPPGGRIEPNAGPVPGGLREAVSSAGRRPR